MNYIEQLNLFAEYNRLERLSPGTQLLWRVLMQINNELRWKSPFQFDNAGLLIETGFKSEKTLIKHRDELVEEGLLIYKSGCKNNRSLYELVPLRKGKDSVIRIGDKRADGEEEEKIVVEKKPKKRIDYDSIYTFYNDHRRKMPKITKMTDGRKTAIKNTLKKFTMEDIRNAFLRAEQSDFLNGLVQSGNGRSFTANFDWILKPANFIKVLEGNYDNRESVKPITTDEYLTAVASGIMDYDGNPIGGEEGENFTDYEIEMDADLMDWVNGE